MSHNPFTHSHALHVVIPTTAAPESMPKTPSERTGPHGASFTNPDAVPGSSKNQLVDTRVQHDGESLTHSHSLVGATVPSTPVQSGAQGVPPTPITPRASRRATRTGSRFSVGEDHEQQEGDGKGEFIAEAAMMLGVMAGHLVAGYLEHEEPSSKKGGHGDEKEDA